MKRSVAVLAGLVLGMLTLVAGVAGPASGAPFCGIQWGSLPKVSSALGSQAQLTNIRAGRHDCYDRLVLDVDGKGGGWDVRYVDRLVAAGSGAVVRVDGGARLQVVALIDAHDQDGDPTYSPADRLRAVDVTGFSTLEQVAFISDFENRTQIGVGVRARLPFRVFELDGPGRGHRIVLDVAHRW